MADNDKNESINIIQNHSGFGDNVREKYVLQAISPNSIQGPITAILTSLRYRDPNSARDKLAILNDTSQLDTQAIAVLNVLAVLIKNASGEDVPDEYQIVESCLDTQPGTYYEDIALSTKLRSIHKNEGVEEARHFYQSIEKPGAYCNEVFYEFIAQDYELENIFKHNIHQLNEITLYGLTRGFIRIESLINATACSDRLLLKYPNFNSKLINLITRYNLLINKLNYNHYWLTSATDRKKLLCLAQECTNLLEECEAKDSRILNQSRALLNFLADSYEPLVNTCWKYYENIKNINQELAKYIQALCSNSTEGLSGIPLEIKKSLSDKVYKKSLINRLKSEKKLSSEEVLIFVNVADSTTIKEWLDQGGEAYSENEFEKQFHQIELLCYANDYSAETNNKLMKITETFINENRDILTTLNPVRLNDMCTMLFEAGLSIQVSKLLHPIIPKKDLWPSPLLKIYINSLLGSQQLTTLDEIFMEINQKEWCEFIWQAKARQLQYQNNLDEAILAIEMALKLSPKSLAVWHYLIHLLKINNTDIKLYKEYLNNIPSELFVEPNQQSLQLLFELAIDSDYQDLVDNILVSWFITDPENSAKPITDFHFNICILNNEAKRSFKDTTANCIGGFHYSLDNKDTTKLVVNHKTVNHSSIIHSSSPLAKQLLKMRIGETVQYNASDLTLLEKLPPYVAVFRLSLDIRGESNDGSDSFYKFTIPEDIDGMISNLEKRISALQNGDDREDFFKNPRFPLFSKGHLLGNQCPVQSAILHLTSKLSFKHPLPNVGIEQPNTLILDVYSVTYLGLTGLIYGLESKHVKIIITNETKIFLKNFIEDLNRDDYLQIGVNQEGKLWRSTADDIKKQTIGIQYAINYILEIAVIEYPKMANMPIEIMQIQNAVDLSIFSSMKLSIVNNIPWLCIDEAFAQLAHKSNYQVVNALKFLTTLGEKLSIEKKLPGLYLNVMADLPYPITYEELFQMCSVDDNLAHYFLSEILKKYPNIHEDNKSAMLFLHKIILLAIYNACNNSLLLFNLNQVNPLNNLHTQRLFNVCCHLTIQKQDGEIAERKLAKLFCALFITSKGDQLIFDQISHFGAKFVTGHFLSFEAINKYIKEILNDEGIF